MVDLCYAWCCAFCIMEISGASRGAERTVPRQIWCLSLPKEPDLGIVIVINRRSAFNLLCYIIAGLRKRAVDHHSRSAGGHLLTRMSHVMKHQDLTACIHSPTSLLDPAYQQNPQWPAVERIRDGTTCTYPGWSRTAFASMTLVPSSGIVQMVVLVGVR